MATMQRVRRAVVVGALITTAAVAPAYAVLSTPESASQATGRCLAWIGARDTGECISYSNGGGIGQVAGGIPPVSVGSQNSGNPGLSTGPLLPGQTINIPVPIG